MSAIAVAARPAAPVREPMGLAFVLMLIYIALVYIRPQEYPGSPVNIPLQAAFMTVSFVAWLLGSGKSFEAPQHALLGMLLFAIVISQAMAGWLGGGLFVFLIFAPQLLMFLVISTSMNGVRRHELFIRMLALATTALALHGVLQFNAPDGRGWSGAQLSQTNRITYIGIFNDPNDLALAFVMALPLAAYLFSRARNMLARAFWLGCSGLLIYALYLTNSRGGLIAAGVEVLVYTWMRRGVASAAVLGAIGVAGMSLIPSRLETLDASEESAAGRVEAWYAGLEMFKSHPLFGVGTGNFTEYHELTAHNSFVLAFAELGVFGYFFWLAFVVLSVSMAWRVARLGPSTLTGEAAKADTLLRARYRKIGGAYLFSLLGFLAGAFFLSRTYNVLLTIGCASCVALYQDARRRWPAVPTYRLREWLGSMVVIEAGSIAAMFVIVRVLLLKVGA